MPPNLPLFRAGCLATCALTRSGRNETLWRERTRDYGLPYTAQDLPQHLVAHAAPTPPVMPAAVVPVVAVPFTLDQPEHSLRVAEVTPDLADVHVRPFLTRSQRGLRTVLLIVM